MNNANIKAMSAREESYSLRYFLTSPGSIVIFIGLLPALLGGYDTELGGSLLITTLCFAAGLMLFRVKASWSYDKRPPVARLWTPKARWHDIEKVL